MATDTVFPPTDSMGAASEIAGNDAVSDTSAQDSSNTSSNMNDQLSAGSAPEDTLESHEVIELHAFIERKVWIDEKIQVGLMLGCSTLALIISYVSSLRNCRRLKYLLERMAFRSLWTKLLGLRHVPS